MERGMKKIAVVTPYHKEAPALLSQGHRSVLDQTYPCTHIMVADGHPSPAVPTDDRTLHLVLPLGNADIGNTPRFFGAALAQSYGFDAVAFLDADNWYEPDHVASLLAAHEACGCPLIAAKRNFYSDAGVRLDFTEAMEDNNQHVDTNCWMIFKEAFDLLRYWRVPKEFHWVGDRIFLQKAIHDRYRIGFTHHRTVNYRTRHAAHFRHAGLPVPDGAIGSEPLEQARKLAMTVDGVATLVNFFGFYPRF
jgi:glycosyltransferase involved in cell wall biosynthesis